MARRKNRTALIKQSDANKLGISLLNVRRLWEDVCDDVASFGRRLDECGSTEDDPAPLMERVVRLALQLAEAERDHSKQMSTLRFIAELRTRVLELEAAQKTEATRLAIEAQKSQNQLWIEERKLAVQERLAEGGTGDWSPDDLRRIAGRS